MRGNIYAFDDGISHYEGTLKELSILTFYNEKTLQNAYYEDLTDKPRRRNYTVKKLRQVPRAIDNPDYFKNWRANHKDKCVEYRKRSYQKKKDDIKEATDEELKKISRKRKLVLNEH